MKIELSTYQNDWPQQFECEKEALTNALPFSVVIEHVGSTSVIGLSAKPIIDIQLGVGTEAQLDELIAPLKQVGYSYFEVFTAQVPERRFFQKMTAPQELEATIPEVITAENFTQRHQFRAKVNLHCVVFGSNWWDRHLRFRNRLRADESLRRQYQELKEELAQKDWQDTTDYAAAKTTFIRTHEATLA